jgi:glyoxylate reductase
MDKILVARAIFPDLLDELKQRFDVESNQEDKIFGGAELRAKLSGKVAVLTTASEQIDSSAIASAPNLRAICNMAVGYNNIDLHAAHEAGITVTNTPDVLNETTADFGWALLMSTARRVTEAEHWLRAGNWKQWSYDSFLGQDVHGSTLGIIGMGRIGQAIARRSIGFRMKVLYHNRSRLNPELEREANNAQYASKETLLKNADHVILVLPHNSNTHHTISVAELGLMKPTATLINLARGGIVDDQALIAALQRKQLAAAGLDVFENEPNFNQAYLNLSNVVLTPHIASASEPTRRAMAQCAIANMQSILAGGPPINAVL